MTVPTAVESAVPPGIWRYALSSALRVDWSRIEPLAALRCTLGVAVPLLVALLIQGPAAGMFVAVGAVSTGFGSFQGAYRSRAATMLCAALGMSLSLFVGSLAGHTTAMATVAAAAWGLSAGFLVALGPAAAFVALQSAVAVLVAGAYASSPAEAAGRALLVLAGALAQLLLVVGLWPLKRFQSERQVLGQVYSSLAEYAASLPGRPSTAPEPHTLARVDPLHSDPQPFARSSELAVFHGLLDQAERIRAGLAVVSLMAHSQRDQVAADLSIVLRGIADAVNEGDAPEPLPAEWQRLDAAAAVLRQRSPLIDALLAQARAACRMAAVPADGAGSDDEPARRRWKMPPVRTALITIRANLSLRSTTCRHAIRLAAALAVATAVYRLTGLPRGYWFPMTTLLVLKPEFHETYVTGITRILGTLAGAGLAVLLLRSLGSHPAVVIALLLVFVWSGYALFRATYTAFTVCITGYIVLLLHLASGPGPAATTRALDTLLGGALALSIYRLWPTWESSHVGEVLAVQAAAMADDTDVLLGAYVDPARWDPAVLQRTLAAARLARSNAEASVERMLGEPVAASSRSHFDSRTALSLVAAFRRYALGALALHAGLDTRPERPVPGLVPLRAEIVESLRILASAFRDGSPPAALPPLRQTQLVSQTAVDPALAEQTDVLIESVNTLAMLLSSRAV